MSMDVTSLVPRWAAGWARAAQPSTKFVPVTQLRELRECEQVAAVCYRVRDGVIEFLLVRTGGGRWIFPKGHAEPGLTHAQAAALEAFEEAGVHGRIEEVCFIRYTRHKRDARSSSARSIVNQVSIHAHLCEVLRLESPQESGRNPTWFSAGKAKRRLREERSCDYGTELAGVIDHAVKRIHQLGSGRGGALNAARKVEFIDVRQISPVRQNPE